MKNTLKKTLSLLLAFTLILGTVAVSYFNVDWSDFAVKALEPIMSFTEGYYTCTVDGNGNATIKDVDESIKGDIVIPSIIAGYNVKHIGESSFSFCNQITKITIEKGIFSIGGNAFRDCSSLVNISIPDSVGTIGDSAFYKCYSLSDIYIPDSVNIIGNGAFDHCSNLKSIVVDQLNSTYSCDEYGVLFNKNKSVLIRYPEGNTPDCYTIPSNVTNIEESAFIYCHNLKNIIIPDNVIIIGYQSFYGCSQIENIIIGNSVITIGDGAFGKCYSLKSLTIPNSVTNIGNSLVNNCPYFTDIYYLGTEEQWNKINIIEESNGIFLDAIIHFYSVENNDINNINSLKLYSKVFEQYCAIIEMNYDSEYFFENQSSEFNYVNSELIHAKTGSSDTSYYALYDIDNNGIQELFIGTEIDGIKKYDLFTYNAGIIYKFSDDTISYDFGYRANFIVNPNGIIGIWSDGGINSTGWYFYKYGEDGYTPELLDHLSKNDGKLYSNDINITQAEFDNAFKKHIGVTSENWNSSDQIVLSWKVINGSCVDKYSQFNENSYIADIWLNKREGGETQESKLIENILTFDSISTQYSDSLSNNTKFQNSLKAWNGLKLVFDTENAINEMDLSKTDIYEMLILDMIKKSLAEKQKDYTNIILDSVNTMGQGSKTVTKYKGIADNLINMVGKPTEDLLEILKEWKFNPQCDSFSKFYGSLNDIYFDANKWENNKFIQGIGAIAESANGVADFYERLVGYCMAMDMSDDMKTLLNEMHNQTYNQNFKDAIQRVLACVENSDFAALFCLYETYEDAMINFVGYCFDEVAKSSKIYMALKKAYEGAVAFNDITFGTSGTISAYYLADATAEFVSANRAAINSLGQRYILTGKEADASVYVFSILTYGHVVAIDWETGANFVKKATDEGLLNLTNNVVLKIKNFFTGNDEKSSYEEYLKTKDTVLKCWDEFYSLLNTTWKYSPEYLKSDFPEMYLVFVGDEILKSEYTPNIFDAFIAKSGKTQIVYSLNSNFNIDGKKYDLYRYDVINGIYASEICENEMMSAPHTKTEVEYDISEVPNPIEFYNEKFFKSRLSKKYTLQTYSEVNDEKVFSKESVFYVGNPIKKVEIGYCSVVDLLLDNSKELGLPLKIKDSTSSYYDNVYYDIYRKTKDSDWTLIATIPRTFGFSGDTTVFYDRNISLKSEYTYKVISHFEFDNGILFYSDESDPVTMSVGGIVDNVVGKAELIINVITSFDTVTTSAINELSEKDSLNGIKLSWGSFKGAEKYEIYRKSSYGTVYQLIETVNNDQLTYYDVTVENGVTYIYVVVPCYECNEGKYYNLIDYASGEIEYKLSELEMYVCPNCGEEFTVERLYKMHKIICTTLGCGEIVIRTPSQTRINYGDSIVLHADIEGDLPDGARIEWTADNNNFTIVSISEDGKSCTITPNISGDTIFTVRIIGAFGLEIRKDTQTMTSKAGFFQKIIAFFKKLFGLTKFILEAFKNNV